MNPPDLSIVLPCYRAGGAVIESLDVLEDFLGAFPLTWEVVVVDDGGGDLEPGPWSADGPFRLVRLPRNCGKGAAVRAGMRAASGNVRLYTDVDVPYDLDLILLMGSYITERGFHMVVGDRTLPGSTYTSHLPAVRAWCSRMFSALVRRIVGGGLFDTQCGLKAFRGDVAHELFSVSRIHRFAFDVELLHIAAINRLDVKRIPVRLRRSLPSSVRLLRDPLRMVLDLVRLRVTSARGLYRSEALQDMIAGEHRRARRKLHLRRRQSDEPRTQPPPWDLTRIVGDPLGSP